MDTSSIPFPTEESLHQHGSFVRRLARSLVRDPGQADDVAQETWWRWMHSPPVAANARGWLRTVVHNLAANTRRGIVRRARHEERAARPEALPSCADEAEQAELLGKLVTAVLALEPAQRDTIVALYFRGLSAPALASESGVPLATVRDRQQRALAKLRERLDRDFDGRAAWAALMVRFAGAPSPAGSLAPRAGAASAGLKLLVAAGVLAAGVATWRALARPSAPVEVRLATVQEPTASAGGSVAIAGTPAVTPAPMAAHGLRVAAPTTARSSGSSGGSPALSGGGTSTAEVRGRFVRTDGAPASGVHLVLSLDRPVKRPGLPDPDPASAEDWEDVEADSAADGGFALSFPCVAGHAFALRATAPGFADARWLWMETAAGQVRELGEIQLCLAATVEGRIVDAHGAPRLGETWDVSLRSVGLAPRDGREELSLRARSDPATGAFLIEGAMPGANRLDARTALWGKAEVPLLLLAEGQPTSADLACDGPDLGRRIVLSLRMEERSMRQPPAAEHMKLLGAGRPRTAAAIRGAAWGYAFDDVGPGSYTLEIDDPRFLPWRAQAVAPGSVVKAELVGSSALLLHVLDGASRAPVEPDSVRLIARNASFFPNEFLLHSGATPLPARLEGLCPGDYTLAVAAGERSATVDFTLAAHETRALRVELHGPSALAGTLRDGSGAPCAGVEILLLRPAEEQDSAASPVLQGNQMAVPDSKYRKELARTVSEADGRFRVAVPRAGSYLLAAVRSGFVEQVAGPLALAPGESRDGHALVLARSGSVACVVHGPGGRSTDGLRVLVLSASGEYVPEAGCKRTLGADGAFALEDLPPGSYDAYLLLPQVAQHVSSGWTSTSGFGRTDDGVVGGVELGTFEIAEGTALDRDFSPPLSEWPGTLELRVLVNGAPAPLVHLDLRQGEGEECDLTAMGLETDAEGRITGARIFAGTWHVTVRDPDGAWSVALEETLPVSAGQPTVRTLDVQH